MSQATHSIPHFVLALAAIVAVTALAVFGKVPAGTAVIVIISAAGIGTSSGLASMAVSESTMASNGHKNGTATSADKQAGS